MNWIFEKQFGQFQ